ncbi:MAG: peroxiredoxin family protein [Hyphomonas sp.]
MSRTLTLATLMAMLPATGAVLPLAAQAEQAAAVSIGPEVGSTPAFGPLVDASGAPADMTALAGSRGTVVAFVRSADWCPFCKKQLVELEAAKAPLAAQGWSLVSVSYDTPEKLADFAEKSAVSYPLLSDTGSETITAFNLLNDTVKKGTRSYGIPHPALVFVGADGKIEAVLREDGYRNRPAVEAVIATATGLTSGS